MKYVTCPICGANLDHGEICDCGEKHAALEAAKEESPKNGNEEVRL